MNKEEWTTAAEVIGLKTRARFMTLIRFTGLLLVVIGGFNMLLAPLVAAPPLLADVYVPLLVELAGSGLGLFPHVAVMVIGALIAWFI